MEKYRPLFLLLIILVGLLSIYTPVDPLIFNFSNSSNGFVLQSTNFFIRYSLIAAFYFAGFALFAYAYLVKRGKILIRPEIENAKPIDKEKSDFITNILLLPGFLCYIISCYHLELFKKEMVSVILLVMSVGYLYKLLCSFYKILVKTDD